MRGQGGQMPVQQEDQAVELHMSSHGMACKQGRCSAITRWHDCVRARQVHCWPTLAYIAQVRAHTCSAIGFVTTASMRPYSTASCGRVHGSSGMSRQSSLGHGKKHEAQQTLRAPAT
eukprot:365366-Chlamydomonas_euryale.AAC.11